jgi:osmotically-inducible protein OsmY
MTWSTSSSTRSDRPPTEPMGDPRYEQERIRQALATDPRVGEPELGVEVVAGRILVTGSVPNERVRSAVNDVVAEVAPGASLDNRVTVPPTDEPTGEETIG